MKLLYKASCRILDGISRRQQYTMRSFLRVSCSSNVSFIGQLVAVLRESIADVMLELLILMVLFCLLVEVL